MTSVLMTSVLTPSVLVRSVLARSVLVCAVIVALSGCASGSAAEPSTPPPSTAPPEQAEPDEGEDPEESDSVLFTVDAAARAIDGTTVALSLVGHQPIVSTDPAASELAEEFLTACLDAGGQSISEAGRQVSAQSLAEHGSSLMRIDYGGTPEDQALLAPVQMIVGIENFPLTGAGDGLQSVGATETCLNRYQLTRSGSGRFVANYETGISDADPTQWVFGSYGFTVPIDSGATLESCTVTITTLGREGIADTEGWQEGDVGTGISCGTGYQGE